jgi:hypothetical protein
MTGTGKYQLTKPGDREIALTRTFDAPRRLVFDAFTKPEMVKRWLYGPADWPLVVCEIDLRVGGKLRYVWRHKERGDMGLTGVFREIVVRRLPYLFELCARRRLAARRVQLPRPHHWVMRNDEYETAAQSHCHPQARTNAA